MSANLESKHQQALINWATVRRMPQAPDIEPGAVIADYLFAIPNGGHRSKITAAKLKREGVKAGVHDMFLPVPRQGLAGLWLEMKAGKGRPSPEQREWAARMERASYAVVFCWHWAEAAKAIADYLGFSFEGAPQRVKGGACNAL